MSQDLSTLNIAKIVPRGFFNELETDVMNFVLTNGSGFYKLTYDKNVGLFLSAELATEAPDTAVLVYLPPPTEEESDPSASIPDPTPDRLIDSDANYDYLYVNFLVY